MIILTIRTDRETAEVGVYDDHRQLAYKTWPAHRQLADTLHSYIVDTLMAADSRLHLLDAVGVYQGPGSFTGLRIGISVANALAYALGIPIAAATGDDWIAAATDRLLRQHSDYPVVPHYGAQPHITAPKH